MFHFLSTVKQMEKEASSETEADAFSRNERVLPEGVISEEDIESKLKSLVIGLVVVYFYLP